MSNNPRSNVSQQSDLKRRFEAALNVVNGSEDTRAAGTPILQPEFRSAKSEKQAISDAARALAQLWKVSPQLVR